MLLCAAIWSACGTGGVSTPECNSLTCAGCCTTDGRCETGGTTNACGTGGAACSACSDSQECTSGRCEAVDAGSDAGAPPDGGQNPDGGSLPDGGADGGCPNCQTDAGPPFAVYTVDSRQFPVAGFEMVPLFQMQLAPNGNIGIAYVELSADQTSWKPRPDPNIFNYDVLYAEWNNGALVLGPERVTGELPRPELCRRQSRLPGQWSASGRPARMGGSTSRL